MKLMKVKILRPFYCSLPGGRGRDVRPGDEAEVPESLFDTLSGDGYIEALGAGVDPAKPEASEPAEESKLAVKPAAPIAQPVGHPKAAPRTPSFSPPHRTK